MDPLGEEAAAAAAAPSAAAAPAVAAAAQAAAASQAQATLINLLIDSPLVAGVLQGQQDSARAFAALTKDLQEREARRAEVDAVERKQRQAEQLQSEAEASLRSIAGIREREMATQLTAVATLQNEVERRVLAKAVVDTIAMLDKDPSEIEESNEVLLQAIKKIKSITPEQQTEMHTRIKNKKRKASEIGVYCTRCHRHGSHEEPACTAGKTAEGVALPPREGTRRYTQPRAYAGAAPHMQQPATGAAAFFDHHAVAHAAALHAQQAAAMHAAGLGGAAGPPHGSPPMLQSRAGWNTMSSTAFRPAGPCFNCTQHGHKAADCTNPHVPNQMGRQIVQGNAGPQVSWTERRTQPREGRDARKERREVNAEQRVFDSTHLRVVKMNVETGAGSLSESARETLASSASSCTEAERNVKAPEAARSEEDSEPSLAGWYAEGAWQVQPEPDGDEAVFMYSTVLEADQSDTAMASDVVPALVSNGIDEEQMTRVAERGEVMGSSGHKGERLAREAMQVRASLRGEISKVFGSKKKILGDAVADGMACLRCKKNGHDVESCPDQTQDEASDRSPQEGWVRALLKRPRVDIAAVNAGLTLEQGVEQWLQRGAEMNAGNPWEKSKQREDSLRRFLGYHKAMGMSDVHIGWIGFGVPLYFVAGQAPTALEFKNHRSAEQHAEFLDKEHADRVADGSFVQVRREQLRGVAPLQVAKHPVSGKLRLCQDLRWINGHLPNVKFKMESLHKELGDVVQQGDELLTTDIAKAYYCLAMHPDAQPWLGWKWRGQYYMPSCLVFGLAPAPRIFTKIMRPMMVFFRSLGVRVLGMIDDYLWADRPGRIIRVRSAVKTVLPQLGWSFNEKCEWTPAHEALMLGMLVNTKAFVVRAPDKKVRATEADVALLLRKMSGDCKWPVHLKEMQRLTGRLMSMMLAYEAVRVFTRALYRCIAVALEGNEIRKMQGMAPSYHLQLTVDAREELEFWMSRLRSHNGLAINCREHNVQVLLWSDASDMGWGGEAAGVEVKVTAAGVAGAIPEPETRISEMAHGMLPREEIKHSSTRRELVALLLVARSPRILAQIQGRTVLVLMDSKPAIANLVKGGGPVEQLCSAVKEWARFCEMNNIKVVYDWVERAQNWRADRASKLNQQQHTWKKESMEDKLREQMDQQAETRWQPRTNHWRGGKVAVFLPMFHQIDARVEMIRAQLDEAVIVVPRWPGGASTDWHRRIREHSIAVVAVGRVGDCYKERPQTGHNDELDAFWLLGRRGDRRRAERAQASCH